MRAVVQRVTEARVTIAGSTVGQIGPGVLVLVGITQGDGTREAQSLADKAVNLRIFPDDEGKMNRSLRDVNGAVLVVSQFTLYGDARKGRRPSFVHAAQGHEAKRVYEEVVNAFRSSGIDTQTGKFGATMDVTLTNSGPVTLLLDSDKMF